MKRKLYSKFSPLTQRFKNLSFKLFIAVALLLGANTVNGQTAEALHFDGGDDLVTLPFLVSGSYTKEAWIYPTTMGGFHNITSGENTALYINGFQLAGGNAFPFTAVVDPNPMSVNTWYHVAITYNDNTKLLSLYKNGILVDDSVLTASYTETTNYLGAVQYFGSPVAFYAGQMDEVRYWNYDRSAAQIAASMNCNLSGDEPGLTAYYKFNQNTANGSNAGQVTLADSSDKCTHYDGTLSNFALTGTTSNWVSQGGGGTGVTGICSSDANIMVSGNSNCIISGDVTPSTSDYTDFGTFPGGAVIKQFIIDNTGASTLNISSATITGSSSFTITASPASTVAGGSATYIQVTYFPTSTGVSNATVTINNDDGDEGTYTFAITGNSPVLPVELSFFKAEKQKDKVKLYWQTAQEINNKGFEIQRSKDGVSGWEAIGFVNGKGNSSVANDYSLMDLAPLQGVNAYRLKQIDLDGNYKLGNIVVISFTGKGTISVYPNPVKDRVNIQFSDNSLLNTEVKISSVTGTVVSKIKLTDYRQQLDLGSLAKGTYLLSFANGSVERIVKQ